LLLVHVVDAVLHLLHHGLALAHHLLLGHLLLGHLLLHHLGLQGAPVLGVVHVVDEDFLVELADTFLSNKVLDLIMVKAHSSRLLNELFLQLLVVYWDLPGLLSGAHGELLLQDFALLFALWVGHDVVLPHEVEQLGGQLLQRFFRQHLRVVLEVVEGDELDDVRVHVLAHVARVEGFFVAVELLHVGEIGVADANYDDGHGKLASTDDLINCFGHVIDNSIGNQKKHVEFLLILRNFFMLS